MATVVIPITLIAYPLIAVAAATFFHFVMTHRSRSPDTLAKSPALDRQFIDSVFPLPAENVAES